MTDQPSAEIVETRRALLDALEAIGDQIRAVVVIGAQAVFIHSGGVDIAIAVTTKDADLAVDPGALNDNPLLEAALAAAGFHKGLERAQPGIWFSDEGIEVDFLVPESLAGEGKRDSRGARIPPHDKHATRRATGLEASLVDNEEMEITSFEPNDRRSFRVKVAGRAAVLVSKLHKLSDRIAEGKRISNKDAHDIYRLISSDQPDELATKFATLASDDLAGETTLESVRILKSLFGDGPTSEGCRLAGATEEGVGDPDAVALATSILATELIAELTALGLTQET